jgi:small subunit ribosomal protein S1
LQVQWWGDPLIQLKIAKKNNTYVSALVRQVIKEKIEGSEEEREVAILDFGGLRGRCIDEEFNTHKFNTLRGFVGHHVDVCILSIDEEKGTFEASGKQAELMKREQTLKTIKPGDIVEGIISGWNPEKKTIFIDIGGVDGFCYLSDWGYKRYTNVQDVGQIGQPVKMMVKSIFRTDPESDDGVFIRLSRIETLKDPWENAEARFPVGSDVAGVVVNIDQNHIFVDIDNGVTLLAEVPKRSNLPKPLIGQPVRGQILKIDEKRRRGRLLITGYPLGVPRHENFGAFVFAE